MEFGKKIPANIMWELLRELSNTHGFAKLLITGDC